MEWLLLVMLGLLFGRALMSLSKPGRRAVRKGYHALRLSESRLGCITFYGCWIERRRSLRRLSQPRRNFRCVGLALTMA